MTNDTGQQPLHVLGDELLADVAPLVALAFILGQQNPDANEFLCEDERDGLYVSRRLNNTEKFEEEFQYYVADAAIFMEQLEAQCGRLDYFESGEWEAKLVTQIQQGVNEIRRRDVRIDALMIRNRELVARDALLTCEHTRLTEQLRKATERIALLEQKQEPAVAVAQERPCRRNQLAASIAAVLPVALGGSHAADWSL